MRRRNEIAVVGEIRSNPTTSRAEIAERIGLSQAAVSRIVGRLIAAALVEEVHVAESTLGRPRVQLTLRGDAGYVIGAKVTETACLGVLVDLNAVIVARAATPLRGHTPGEVTQAVAHLVANLAAAAKGQPVFGVGVGMPGAVNATQGIVRRSPYFGWRDVDLRSLLADAVEVPVIVDNDVNALTARERLDGPGAGVDDFAVVTVGRGVGLGLVLGGRQYRGSWGGAGEFGHVKIAAEGQCECGGVGCLEALTSDPAIAAAVSAATGRSVDIAAAVALARSGNEAARGVFLERGRLLGVALGSLVNLLNPTKVLLVGEAMAAADLFVSPLQSALRSAAIDEMTASLSVTVQPWQDEAWALGAASLVLSDLFQPELAPAIPARVSPLFDLVG